MRNAAGEPPGGWQPCGEEMDLSNPTTRTLTLKIFQPRGKDNPDDGISDYLLERMSDGISFARENA